VYACDTGKRDQVAAVLDRIASDGPPLSSVIHSANTAYLARLDDTDVPGLSLSLGAKAAGADWLDELTADLDLDAFVLFSSISATWGSNDHGAYAAGNAYLDALAENRRARGLPGTSIAWGVWDTRDWAAVDAILEDKQDQPGSVTPAKLRRQGVNFLEPGPALAALGHVLDDQDTFIALADVNWEKFAPVFSVARHRPLLNELPEVRLEVEAANDADAGQADQLTTLLSGVAPTERERVVTELVRTHAAAVLGHPSIKDVPATRAFREMGFDSLTAVELRNRLNSATGLRLPSTLVFDYPTPVVLAKYLLTEVSGKESDCLPALEELERLGSALSSQTHDDEVRIQIAARLEAIAQQFRAKAEDDTAADRELAAATADEMFDLVEEELNNPDFD
jgi:acyl carrier protein